LRLQARHPAPKGRNAQLASRQQRRAERGLAFGEAQQVSGDAHLTVALLAGADADHRKGELRAQIRRQLLGHVFKHQRKAAGGLQIAGLSLEPLLADGVLGLAAVAQLVHGLGGQPQMPHHRNAAAHQPIHHLQGFRFGSLQLHACGGTVLQHLAGGGHRRIGSALVAEERQVGDDQRPLVGRALQAAPHGAGVQDHLLQGHRQGGGVAEHHHRQGVAHQDHIGAGLFHEGGRERIPGREHRNWPALLLADAQISWSHAVSPSPPRPIASIRTTRTHAARTPKSGQNRKGAATRDAPGRRGFRVTLLL